MDESTINEWYSFYLFEYQLFISDMITLFCLELITPFFVNVFGARVKTCVFVCYFLL